MNKHSLSVFNKKTQTLHSYEIEVDEKHSIWEKIERNKYFILLGVGILFLLLS